jgi:hypothetical protein
MAWEHHVSARLEQYVQSPLLECSYGPFGGFKMLEVIFDGKMGVKGECPTPPFPISEATASVGGMRSRGLCAMHNEH